MKTAMQELKFFISEGLDNLDESIKVSEIWEKIDEYIETEKQQIIDAYWEGKNNGFATDDEYYTSTFTTNKETLK